MSPLSQRVLIVVLVSVLAGTYSFLLFTTPYAFYSPQVELATLNRSILAHMELIDSRSNALTYGIVVSVEPIRNVIEIDSPDDFNHTAALRLRIRVEPNAYIARQELRVANGVADSLSEKIPASLSDIRPGNRVAVLVKRTNEGALSTDYILFGNPL